MRLDAAAGANAEAIEQGGRKLVAAGRRAMEKERTETAKGGLRQDKPPPLELLPRWFGKLTTGLAG